MLFNDLKKLLQLHFLSRHRAGEVLYQLHIPLSDVVGHFEGPDGLFPFTVGMTFFPDSHWDGYGNSPSGAGLAFGTVSWAKISQKTRFAECFSSHVDIITISYMVCTVA